MNDKELLLDSLDRSGTAYRGKLQEARNQFSRKSVHDLRTSLRRLLSTLDVIAFFTSASRIEKLSDRLEDQLDDFSDLRDIQVMLDRVSDDTERFPELEAFQADLKKRRKLEQRSDEKRVEDIKPGRIRKQLQKVEKDLEDLSPEELRGKLPQAVDEAYLTVIQRYGEVDSTQPVSIHHLRVAFKKFRYMVETVHPCLPKFPGPQLEHMRAYQTQMGDIHDTQVLLETLAEFSDDPSDARRFYEQSLADQLSEFLANKDVVLRFWRATPLSAYPWQEEKKGNKP